MKSTSTFVWFLLAAALATAIWLMNTVFQTAPVGEKPLFAGLIAGQVTSIQVIPAGGREISVVRTNHGWQLERPIAYPAQAAAIDGLLDALEKLTPALSLSPAELSGHKDAEAEFGFDNPQFKVDLLGGGQTWHLVVGNKTAPGDGVYVRVVGTPSAGVTDPAWLQFLPRDVSDWRDTALADVPAAPDWLIVTNGTQVLELRRDVTHDLWRIMRPLQQARANNLLVATALEELRTARVSRFVSDDPKADLSTYGLEPSALDIWLGTGTNLLAAVHLGKDVSGVDEIYARREGLHTVVSTPKSPLLGWRGTVNDFRDPNLLEFTAPSVAEIEVRATNNNYTLQRGANGWSMAGEKFAVDPALVATLLKTLAGLRITDFVQDAVTPADLQSFGLARPAEQITLRGIAGNTNSTLAQLLFTATTNEILVKRSDEASVYALSLANLNQLSVPGDYFRDHHVWSFSPTNVAAVAVQQNGKFRRLLRSGTNDWTLAPGSQGIVNPSLLEEAMNRLGSLTTMAWIGRKASDFDLGLNTNSLSVTIELKSGEKYAMDFGKEVQVSPNINTALAVATLDGERWAFIFPPVLCPLIGEALTIPPDAP